MCQGLSRISHVISMCPFITEMTPRPAQPHQVLSQSLSSTVCLKAGFAIGVVCTAQANSRRSGFPASQHLSEDTVPRGHSTLANPVFRRCWLVLSYVFPFHFLSFEWRMTGFLCFCVHSGSEVSLFQAHWFNFILWACRLLNMLLKVKTKSMERGSSV